jgi:hypothetical protein
MRQVRVAMLTSPATASLSSSLPRPPHRRHPAQRGHYAALWPIQGPPGPTVERIAS